MRFSVMEFQPIKQDAVLPGGISLHTNFLRICPFLLCKHSYELNLKIVSQNFCVMTVISGLISSYIKLKDYRFRINSIAN